MSLKNYYGIVKNIFNKNKDLFCYPLIPVHKQLRTFSAKNNNGNEIHEYLNKAGYDEKAISLIVKAFPNGRPSIQEIKSLGKAGLAELVKAINHEEASSRLLNDSEQPIIIVNVNVPKDNASFKLEAKVGETFFELTKRNPELKSYLECSCNGIAACSTCHVIVDKEFYDLLPPVEESELDMIDLAWGVTETSRLGCQIKFSKEIDGLKVRIPDQSNDLYYAP